jgi:hypothetical protein
VAAMLQTLKSCVLLKSSQLLLCHLTVVSVNVSEMAGVKHWEPIAVAGRGRSAIKPMNPVSLGRGKQHSSLHIVLWLSGSTSSFKTFLELVNYTEIINLTSVYTVAHFCQCL